MPFESIRSVDFKCHSDLTLITPPLTLLTGLNAAGKSSAVQGALLLSQALRTNGGSGKVPLNGPLVRLGTAGELINQRKDRGQAEPAGSVYLGFEVYAGSAGWRLGPSAGGVNTTMDIVGFVDGPLEGPGSIVMESASPIQRLLPSVPHGRHWEQISADLRNIIYLGAARLSSHDLFDPPDDGELVEGDVGTNGQFAAWWLARLSDDDVAEARRLESESASTLRRQINAWGSELFPGFEVNVTPLGDTGRTQLQFRSDVEHQFRKPANVGYGLSYAFPILVAGLTAKVGQTLIVDSPEAHLHPRAQSRIGRFLSVIAASGVQVIVETHSDHVLNGIRVAVKERVLGSRSTAVHFFTSYYDDRAPSSVTAKIDDDGRLSEWPEGFFDQIENDLAML